MAKRTEIDQRLFERLCFQRRTKEEIAEICGVTIKALDNWAKRTYDGKTVTQIIGAKKAKIDRGQFEGLCRIQCTLAEIAGVFGLDHKTVERWCEEEYGQKFSQIYAQKRMGGAASLRRAQFEMAHRIPSMSIWWGKQYLGQKEPEKEKEETPQGAAGGPVAFIVDDLPQTEEDAQETAVWGTQEVDDGQGE